MSLKAFHIFFISVSILLAIGFSAWLFRSYSGSGDIWMLVAALASLAAGCSLVLYGIRILKKLKHIGYL
jgi:hypothetical protein